MHPIIERVPRQDVERIRHPNRADTFGTKRDRDQADPTLIVGGSDRRAAECRPFGARLPITDVGDVSKVTVDLQKSSKVFVGADKMSQLGESGYRVSALPLSVLLLYRKSRRRLHISADLSDPFSLQTHQ